MVPLTLACYQRKPNNPTVPKESLIIVSFEADKSFKLFAPKCKSYAFEGKRLKIPPVLEVDAFIARS